MANGIPPPAYVGRDYGAILELIQMVARLAEFAIEHGAHLNLQDQQLATIIELLQAISGNQDGGGGAEDSRWTAEVINKLSIFAYWFDGPPETNRTEIDATMPRAHLVGELFGYVSPTQQLWWRAGAPVVQSELRARHYTPTYRDVGDYFERILRLLEGRLLLEPVATFELGTAGILAIPAGCERARVVFTQLPPGGARFGTQEPLRLRWVGELAPGTADGWFPTVHLDYETSLVELPRAATRIRYQLDPSAAATLTILRPYE